MNKITDYIVKYKKIILIGTIAVLLVSVVGIAFFVFSNKINSDMLEYLPENTSTTKGINFLKENFGVKGDAFIVVEGQDNDIELINSVNKLKKIQGVSQFLWYEDVKTIEDMANSPLLSFVDIEVDTKPLVDYLKQPLGNGKYNYTLLMLFDYGPSTPEAFNVVDMVYEEFSQRSVAVSGMTALAKQVMEETMRELIFYLIFSVLAVAIVLFLATSSYFEPLILMMTLMIAVVVNMGTNIIFPSVSIISFAAAGVLQLGLTMDYAIFFMHAYKKERLTLSPELAVKNAVPKTSVTIVASSLTTIGGFAALCFMDFKIGIDLAQVIIKGILLSLLTVIFLQPVLVMFFDKMLTKTAHKEINTDKIEVVFEKTIKSRKLIIIIAALLIVPAYFAQLSAPFSYLKIYEQTEISSPQQQRATELANQVIMAVPIETKTGGHKDFINEMTENEKIPNVIGAYSAMDMPQDKLEILLDFLFDGVPNNSDTSNPLSTLFQKNNGKWYTLYLIEISGDTEDKKAFACHEHMVSISNKYFDETYPLGVLTGVNDMAKVTPRDFLRVTLISSAVILIVLGLLLKSFRKSFIMIVLIELAIWLNISMNFIFSSSINFMVYIIISSVQLGCTVDYAILLSTKFEQTKKEFSDTKQAAIKAVTYAFPAITTSVAIIIVTCLSIVFVSNNLLVKEMAWVLARGAFISYLLVIIVLPCLLTFVPKTSDQM